MPRATWRRFADQHHTRVQMEDVLAYWCTDDDEYPTLVLQLHHSTCCLFFDEPAVRDVEAEALDTWMGVRN